MRAHDPTDTASINAIKEEQRRQQELKREREVHDFKLIMSEPHGRRFIWRLLSEAGVFRTVFNESHAEMSRLEGKRLMGLMLMAEIQDHCLELYNVMAKEHEIG